MVEVDSVVRDVGVRSVELMFLFATTSVFGRVCLRPDCGPIGNVVRSLDGPPARH